MHRTNQGGAIVVAKIPCIGHDNAVGFRLAGIELNGQRCNSLLHIRRSHRYRFLQIHHVDELRGRTCKAAIIGKG